MPQDEWLVDCLPAIGARLIPTLFWWIFMACLLSCLLPLPLPPPPAGEEGLWLAASQLIECSWHCCSRGQIGTFALQAEKSGFGEIAPLRPFATKAPLKMQIFFHEITLLSFLAVPNLPIVRKGKKKKGWGKGKKYMACNSAEIWFFILITKEANEGISLVFIWGQCDFPLFANTKINK